MTPAICQSIVSAHAAGEAVAAIARRFRLSRQSVYTALRQEGISPRRACPPSGSALEIVSERALLGLLPREGLVLLIGPQGSGKTATAHRLLDLGQGRRPLAVVGPPDLRGHLPAWLSLVPVLQDVPAGALALYDEAHVFASARTAMTASNRDVVHLVGFLRQRGILLLAVAHHASDLDRRLVQHASALLIKRPGHFADLDRPVLRPVLARAVRAFARTPEGVDPRGLTFAAVGDQEVLAQTSLPSYWSHGLSCAFASWVPAAKEPEPTSLARPESGDVRAAPRLVARQEGIKWRLIDGGWSTAFAKAVTRASVDGLAGQRLGRLEGSLKVLLRAGLGRDRLEPFVIDHLPSPLLIAHLTALAETVPAMKHLEPRTAEDLLTHLLAEPALLRPLADALRPRPAAQRPAVLEACARELDRQARARTVTGVVSSILSPATPPLARVGLAGALVWGIRSGRLP